MNGTIKIGIVKETKNPPDRRVALTPEQCLELTTKYPNIELKIQKSDTRAYTNGEYQALGVPLTDDVSDCDILIGIKEVEISQLVDNKTYLFFSHTAKKQEYNKKLLQAIVNKKLTMIDYEYLTDANGIRLVSFGRWAGIVGAYNGIIGYGLLTGNFTLKRAHTCHDLDAFREELNKIKLNPIKILITGGGRVAHGAIEIFEHVGVKRVSHHQFLNETFDEPVYTQIDPWHYYKRKESGEVFDMDHFVGHPYEYESIFEAYTKVTDLLIVAHFWDPRSPVLLTKENYKADDLKIKIIADITCDIDGSIKSTIRASTITKPFYGYNPVTEDEAEAFAPENITIMAVDNLPGEAPRNASLDFGQRLLDTVFPHLLTEDKEDVIKRASITKDGKLTSNFSHLEDYIK